MEFLALGLIFDPTWTCPSPGHWGLCAKPAGKLILGHRSALKVHKCRTPLAGMTFGACLKWLIGLSHTTLRVPGRFLARLCREKLFMTTVFEDETRKARRRLWHLLLEGDRGCIIWWSEDCFQWGEPKYDLTAKARALQPVLKELRGPVARLFMNAERIRDPIFIHYSQASIQVNWLLESTVDGSTWLRRFSSYEAAHNEQAKARTAWLKAFQDLGWAPQFISSEQIESGILRTNPATVLVLPRSWAMSDTEQAEVQKALQQTNGLKRLFVEGPPGVFDSHGRLRSGGQLGLSVSDLPTSLNKCVAIGGQRTSGFNLDLGAVEAQRSTGKGNDLANWIAEQMGEVKQEVRVSRQRLCASSSVSFKQQPDWVAFERNIDYQMDESLAQRGGNEALEKATTVVARLDKKHHVYDIETGRYLGAFGSTRVPAGSLENQLYSHSRISGFRKAISSLNSPAPAVGKTEDVLATAPTFRAAKVPDDRPVPITVRALWDRFARSSQRWSSGSASKSRQLAAMVVSSFCPVGCPTPT